MSNVTTPEVRARRREIAEEVESAIEFEVPARAMEAVLRSLRSGIEELQDLARKSEAPRVANAANALAGASDDVRREIENIRRVWMGRQVS